MPLIKRAEPLDHFELDVHIAPEDSRAQWRIRNGRAIPTAEYLAWCSWLTRDQESHDCDLHSEPFEL